MLRRPLLLGRSSRSLPCQRQVTSDVNEVIKRLRRGERLNFQTPLSDSCQGRRNPIYFQRFFLSVPSRTLVIASRLLHLPTLFSCFFSAHQAVHKRQNQMVRSGHALLIISALIRLVVLCWAKSLPFKYNQSWLTHSLKGPWFIAQRTTLPFSTSFLRPLCKHNRPIQRTNELYVCQYVEH